MKEHSLHCGNANRLFNNAVFNDRTRNCDDRSIALGVANHATGWGKLRAAILATQHDQFLLQAFKLYFNYGTIRTLEQNPSYNQFKCTALFPSSVPTPDQRSG